MDLAIYTEDEYRKALHRFLEICAAPKNTKELEELCKLVKLLQNYEERNCSFD